MLQRRMYDVREGTGTAGDREGIGGVMIAGLGVEAQVGANTLLQVGAQAIHGRLQRQHRLLTEEVRSIHGAIQGTVERVYRAGCGQRIVDDSDQPLS